MSEFFLFWGRKGGGAGSSLVAGEWHTYTHRCHFIGLHGTCDTSLLLYVVSRGNAEGGDSGQCGSLDTCLSAI